MKKFLLFFTILICIGTVSFASFSDVRMYSTEIEDLVSRKIINGYPDGTFMPDAKITRAEFTKMIVLATQNITHEESHFSDVFSNHWAKEYIDIAVTNGLIKGDTEGTFRPDDNITYGEVATILVRAMGKENDAEKIELSWPDNYMNVASKLNLFQHYQTNDLVALGEARRDSTALMIYNMLQEDIESIPKTEEKVDTKMAYAGLVKERMQKNGEPFVTIGDNDKNEVLLKVYKKNGIPEEDSFVIYQLTSNEQFKLRSELSMEDIDDSFINVEKVNEEIVYLEGQEKLLDFDLESYVLNNKKIQLNKINYFVIEIKDEEFKNYELYDSQNLELRKDDKIKFDNDLNVCYIIRAK